MRWKLLPHADRAVSPGFIAPPWYFLTSPTVASRRRRDGTLNMEKRHAALTVSPRTDGETSAALDFFMLPDLSSSTTIWGALLTLSTWLAESEKSFQRDSRGSLTLLSTWRRGRGGKAWEEAKSTTPRRRATFWWRGLLVICEEVLKRRFWHHEQRKEVSLLSLSAVSRLLSDHLENLPCGLPYLNPFPVYSQVNFSLRLSSGAFGECCVCAISGLNVPLSHAHIDYASDQLNEWSIRAVAALSWLCAADNLVSKNVSQSIRRSNKPGLSRVLHNFVNKDCEPQIPCVLWTDPPNKTTHTHTHRAWGQCARQYCAITRGSAATTNRRLSRKRREHASQLFWHQHFENPHLLSWLKLWGAGPQSGAKSRSFKGLFLCPPPFPIAKPRNNNKNIWFLIPYCDSPFKAIVIFLFDSSLWHKRGEWILFCAPVGDGWEKTIHFLVV